MFGWLAVSTWCLRVVLVGEGGVYGVFLCVYGVCVVSGCGFQWDKLGEFLKPRST